jgi:V8-like Glu-specific endopeptidase
MQLRSMTTISALLLGVALIATPALAADTSVAGSKASGDATTSRDAPLTLPGKATPKDTLKVDPATLSRGIGGLDADAAVASMGTVTLSHDGTVAETPASEGMRAIVEQEVKGNTVSMSTDRVVSAPDGRVQVTDASTNPYINVGWLWTQDQKGNWATCTATQIGPKTVITAAHCVYDHATGGWVKAITYLPGVTDAQNAPYGQFDWANVNILKGYIDNYDGTNYGSVMPWDLAEIELSDDATNLGWLGFQVDDASDFKANLIGYPGDKPDGTQWKSTCTIPAKNFGDQIFAHDCDTTGGNSGSALFTDDGKGNFSVRGINVADDGKTNYGLRLVDAYFQFLQDNYK